MGQFIQLTNEISAYEAMPRAEERGGLVIIQEIFGVNAHIREVCDHYAGIGFHVLAPAVFDHIEKNVELGYTADDFPKGRELIQKLGWDQPLHDIQAAIDYLTKTNNQVSVIGYCWGGSVAFLSACRLKGIHRAICYYGRHIYEFRHEELRTPVLFHYGKDDPSIPLEQVQAVRMAQMSSPVYVYDAGHGFNCSHRADYNLEAAVLAGKRTLDFIEG